MSVSFVSKPSILLICLSVFFYYNTLLFKSSYIYSKIVISVKFLFHKIFCTIKKIHMFLKRSPYTMNTTNIEKQNSHLDLKDEKVQEVFSLYEDYPEVPYLSPTRDLDKWLRAVKIGSEKLVPKRNMVRFEEDILPGHLILLWRIQFGTFTTESVFPKYFEIGRASCRERVWIDGVTG